MTRAPASSPKHRVGFGAMILLLLAACSAAATACPNCGADALAAQQNGAVLAQGYTIGAIGLAGSPFLLAGSVIIYVVRAFRRAERED